MENEASNDEVISDEDEQVEIGSAIEECSANEKAERTNRPRIGRIFLVTFGLILLALPSVLMYLERAELDLRADVANYLVFSYALHLRSYWAMTNIDYAIEAGNNDGDYGHTTMYMPLYIKRAQRQVDLAQAEIDSYNGSIPNEVRTSYNQLCDCFDELEDVTDELHNIPRSVVPYGELVSDSVITTWTAREAVRIRFDLRENGIRNNRMDAVSYGYEWVYEDMRLKAIYDLQIEPGQTMFSSSSF